MQEEWRTIPSFPLYQASSLGRVRRHPDHLWRCSGAVLSPGIDARGYHKYILRRDKRSVNALGGRLVCEAFHGPCPSDEHEAARQDGDPGNNKPDNLAWKTVTANRAERRRLGSHVEGDRVAWAVLRSHQIPEIRRRLAAGEKCLSIGRSFGVSEGAINGIRIGRCWKSA